MPECGQRDDGLAAETMARREAQQHRVHVHHIREQRNDAMMRVANALARCR